MRQIKQQRDHIPRRRSRWFLGAITLAIALMSSNLPTALAAVLPGDYMLQNDPMYVNALRFRLAPQSQGYSALPGAPTAAFTWGNGIPNALADYYTYAPLSNVDALKVGFPAACGNKNLLPLPPADAASTADCYIITAKRLNHNFELKSVLDWYVNTYYPTLPVSGGLPLVAGFSWPTAAGMPATTPNPGLIDPASALRVNFSQTNPAVTGLGWATDTYGYGSGGVLWRPPYIEPTAPIALTGTITGSAPPFFQNFPIGSLLGTTVSGVPGTVNTATTGIWHFPAPSIKGTNGRPILVQWLNELPNMAIPGMDPTLDCGVFANCFPYNRITTHFHGGHVGPGSDGLATADYNPDFSAVGAKYTYANTARTAEMTALGLVGPKGTHIYPMTQEAATTWYHDHSMGSTHTNTNQGLAGFFPITDNNEKCLQGIAVAGICPAPVKVLPTGVQELGFALQDRLFDDKGQFYMPDAPIIDANFPTCDKSSPSSRTATCSPLYMYVKHAANPATLTPAGIHLVPYDEAALDLTVAENSQAPLLGPSTSLEYFGNMPIVNGVAYGKYDVDRKLYRMRFLGGTDSRTWIMQLNSKVRGATTVSPNPIPFYVIGSEQGFLNNPVPRTQIVLMPGERIDVLVDFRQVPAGDNQVIMANYGTDGPYQGIDNTTLSAVQSVDIPEIMAFDVSNLTDALLTTSTAPTTSLRVLVPPVAALPGAGGLAAPFPTLSPTNNTRVIALEEIVDQYGRIMPTIDRRGYITTGIPATEIIKLNNVEEWDIINTTADDHPMHLHQVAFQVVSRTPFDTVAFFKDNTAAVNDLVNNVFLPPTYVPIGLPIPPGPFENGWKDTVFTPPGYVTKIRAKFDLVGEYVWHCHILSHEEHDMMRPMVIVNLTANVPSLFTVPTVAAANRTAAVTIGAPVAQPGVTYKYVIEYTQTNSLTPDTWHPVYSTGLTPTIVFPRDGIFSLRVKAVDAGMTPIATDSLWVTSLNTITVAPATDTITLPLAPATLTASTQIFTFTSSSVLYPHSIWVGTTPGGSEIGKFKAIAGATTITATNLPTTGIPLYVRLIVTIPGAAGVPTANRYNDYVYTAFTGVAPALVPTATAATAITASGFTANWTVVAGATGYFLDVSTSSAFTTFLPGFKSRNVANVTNFALTGLNTATKSYYYRVRAHNATLTGANSNMILLLAKNHRPDFDGDGKADMAFWRPSNGVWSITPSYSGIAPYTVAWGVSTDKLVPGDFDGDGNTDIAVYRPSLGDWHIMSSTAGLSLSVQWGMTGDIPVPGDYDGDNMTDVAVYRTSVGNWFIQNSATATTRTVQWGNATDIPVPNDYDGDGKTDIAVWRPSTGTWFIMNSATATTSSIQWGTATDIPVPADYDGDGKIDVAVWRPSTGNWHIIDSSTGTQRAVQWGMSTDKPVPADYDGDGKADIAVRRPSTATGYIINSSTGIQRAVIWGTPTDIPVLSGLPIQ